jgi:hypothetical protein
MSKYSDTPNKQKHDFPEQNTTFATHERRSTPTQNFNLRAHLRLQVSRLSPIRVGFALGYPNKAVPKNREFSAENPTSTRRTRWFTPTQIMNSCSPLHPGRRNQTRVSTRSPARPTSITTEKRNPYPRNTQSPHQVSRRSFNSTPRPTASSSDAFPKSLSLKSRAYQPPHGASPGIILSTFRSTDHKILEDTAPHGNQTGKYLPLDFLTP